MEIMRATRRGKLENEKIWKLENEKMGEWGGNFLEHQLCQNFKLWQSAYRKSDVLGLLGVLERERRRTEDGREKFW